MNTIIIVLVSIRWMRYDWLELLNEKKTKKLEHYCSYILFAFDSALSASLHWLNTRRSYTSCEDII